MSARSVLWADLRIAPHHSNLCASLPRSYGVQRVTTVSDIFQALRNWLPWAVCFEFDRPDSRRLEAMSEMRRRFQSLPVVIVTERHSEALANYAFRCCVWDYLVKPLSLRRLCNSLLSINVGAPHDRAKKPSSTPLVGAPAILRSSCSQISVGSPLAPALSYIETNYSEKLQMATAAKLCDLSPFQFSRNFKKANGFTFRDFVVRLRIQRAAELIRHTEVSVTEAAFRVGFNDLSYFARMFRRQLGVTPSLYRTKNDGAEQMSLFSPPRPQQKQESTYRSAKKS